MSERSAALPMDLAVYATAGSEDTANIKKHISKLEDTFEQFLKRCAIPIPMVLRSPGPTVRADTAADDSLDSFVLEVGKNFAKADSGAIWRGEASWTK